MIWIVPATTHETEIAALRESRPDGFVLTTDGACLSWVQLSEPVARPSKCESCGSREFKEHGGQSVCAYCRSGA